MALNRFLKRPSKTLADDNDHDNNILYKCCLKSVDSNLTDIQLKNENPIYIGRSPETGITDVCCSRKQLKLIPNLKKALISIELCGTNFSGLNGKIIEQDKKYEVKHGDIIEILHERYPFKVIFNPEPDYQMMEEKLKMKKMKLSDNENDESATSSSVNENLTNFLDFEWESIENDDLIICTCKTMKNSNKIAAYDLDGTIIKTKSGNVHPKDINDWQILYPEVIKKLNNLYENNFKIVIFTNQAPIGNGRVQLKDFQIKIENIIKKLKIPIQVFIATKSNYYRKPRIGMWEYLENMKNDNIKICKDKSFYVGDAAGRLQQKQTKIINKHKKDHSCADRLFALNINLQFFTPEEHFLNHKPLEYEMPKFNPKQEFNEILTLKNYNIPSNNCEMIIMVGLPSSGKSFFAKEHLEKMNYKIINRDKIGTIDKCLKLCEEYLLKKHNCVIDNTNLDIESRKRFINLSKKYSIDCRCFLMNTTLEHIKHNLIYRELTDKEHVQIKDQIFFSLKKKYVEPKIDEGFKEIIKIEPFAVKNFKDDFHEKLYKMYLVEK